MRVIPWQPGLGVFKNSGGVFLDRCKVVVRVDIIENAGFDYAHQNISNFCTSFVFEKIGVLTIEDGSFELPFVVII